MISRFESPELEPPQPLHPSPGRRFPSPTPHIDAGDPAKSPIPYIV